MADQEIENAVSRALEDAPERNFRETVDLAVNLRDLDLNDPSNRVDESVVLPAGTGQETTIVVFAEGETASVPRKSQTTYSTRTNSRNWVAMTTPPRTSPMTLTSSSQRRA